MLKNVNLLYLGCSVLCLIDISYLSRFWTQFEAWLSMQAADSTGLHPAKPGRQRHTFKCIHNATAGNEDEKLRQMWATRKPAEAKELLAMPDVTVTNASDKETQLVKIAKLDQEAQAVFTVAYALQLKAAGAEAVKLVEGGFTLAMLKEAGFTLAELRDGGVSVAACLAAGTTKEEMAEAGIEECVATLEGHTGWVNAMCGLGDGCAERAAATTIRCACGIWRRRSAWPRLRGTRDRCLRCAAWATARASRAAARTVRCACGIWRQRSAWPRLRGTRTM